jgi:hypothetical protein
METLTPSEGAAHFKRQRSKQPPPTVPIPTSAELLTRQQAALYLTASGFPTSEQLLAMLGMAAHRTTGPPIAGVWGRRVMYRPADLLAWARARAGLKDQ